MNITVTESAGFCFGVERAVTKVYELAQDKENGKIYTVGNLIHNPHIINELKSFGVSVIDSDCFSDIFDLTNEKSPSTIVIRTHGITKNISERLNDYAKINPYFKICDVTCPYVKKIHRLVSENSQKQLVIFGDADHPEVAGIKSYSDLTAIVISSPDQVFDIKSNDLPTIAVAQTTQNTVLWEKCQENLKSHFRDIKVFDTICRVTDERQSETREMAKKVDIMLVIGGKESSNTGKLYQTAKKELDRTFMIEDESDLKNIKFTSLDNVGITAGASTPNSIIKKVKQEILKQEF